jgi:hypothetical protein
MIKRTKWTERLVYGKGDNALHTGPSHVRAARTAGSFGKLTSGRNAYPLMPPNNNISRAT